MKLVERFKPMDIHKVATGHSLDLISYKRVDTKAP
jgi:hypothetical protein